MQLQTHGYSRDTLLWYIIIKSLGITTQTQHSNTNATCMCNVHVTISAGDNFAIFICIDGVGKISVWKPIAVPAI